MPLFANYLSVRSPGSTLFNHFYIRPGAPYPISYFNTFGRIHHDGQTAVVADEIGFAAKRDKPVSPMLLWRYILNLMVCQYRPIAHRLIGGPSCSSYFYQCAMLVRVCPSPEPLTNWGLYPDVLNRTLRGHSIVSRSQKRFLLSAVPSQTGLNIFKCLVQDLFLHPMRN